jgi:hypothetical protein
MRVIYAPIFLLITLAVSRVYSEDGVADMDLFADDNVLPNINIIDHPYQVS